MGKPHYLMTTRLFANLSTKKNRPNRPFLILLFELLKRKNEIIHYVMISKYKHFVFCRSGVYIYTYPFYFHIIY